MVLDGPMTGETFRAYVEQFPAPALSPGDVVVLDNLPAHKVAGIREALTAVGASILYLPPYSRSEEHTSELKSLMRISYAVFCLKKKTNEPHTNEPYTKKPK